MSPNLNLDYHGYQVRFFSDDGSESPHVHVHRKGSTKANAKFWLTRDGFSLAHNHAAFSDSELNSIVKFLNANSDYIKARWMDFFEL